MNLYMVGGKVDDLSSQQYKQETTATYKKNKIFLLGGEYSIELYNKVKRKTPQHHIPSYDGVM